MSLLAEHPNSTKCTAYFTDDTTSLDTVYVSQEIWDTLTDFTDGVEHSNSGTTERIAVSIKFKKYAELQNKNTRSVKLKYLVVWAVKPFNVCSILTYYPNGLTVVYARQHLSQHMVSRCLPDFVVVYTPYEVLPTPLE